MYERHITANTSESQNVSCLSTADGPQYSVTCYIVSSGQLPSLTTTRIVTAHLFTLLWMNCIFGIFG